MVVAIVAPMPAASASGVFSCEAAGVDGVALSTANPANDPCRNSIVNAGYDLSQAQPGPQGFDFEVDADGLDADTSVFGAGGVESDVGGPSVAFFGPFALPFDVFGVSGAVNADAKATCESPAGSPPTLTSSSSVDLPGLVPPAGQPTRPVSVLTQPVNIPIAGVGTLHLNWEQRTSTEIVRRAVYLELAHNPAHPIVVGEARAGFTGNPCQ